MPDSGGGACGDRAGGLGMKDLHELDKWRIRNSVFFSTDRCSAKHKRRTHPSLRAGWNQWHSTGGLWPHPNPQAKMRSTVCLCSYHTDSSQQTRSSLEVGLD